MPNGGVQPIGDAAVVGAGDEGRWIALSLALGGFKVVLVDSPRENLCRAFGDVHKTLGDLKEREMVDRWIAERALRHLVPSSSVAGAMDEVGFAVEAVADDLELKCGVLRPRPALPAPGHTREHRLIFQCEPTSRRDQPTGQGRCDQVVQPRPSGGACGDRSALGLQGGALA